MQPIQFYYWPTPNGWKIAIALEEMELPYEVHPVNIGKGEQFSPEFLAISPNNRMPAIVDPEATDGAPISSGEAMPGAFGLTTLLERSAKSTTRAQHRRTVW